MKKQKKQKLFMQITLLLSAFALVGLHACSKDDEPVEDPIATFQYEISEENFLEVSFMNFSQHAISYSWNFGDGNTSTEENPVHVYDEAGEYEVVLTATNSENVSAIYSETIDIKDPFEALTLLAGQTSKTWRLYRIDQSMGVGPSLEAPYDWWSLTNDGSRPCKYYHEFTFNRDGEYIFDDMGYFYSEGLEEEPKCIEAIPENMVNLDGVDVSAWLGGTHQYEYEPSTGQVTLIGEGAWIGLPKVATEGEVTVPQNSVSFKISIEEHEGFDLMHVQFVYDWGVWVFNYASYSDPSLEPEVEEEEEEWGENLPNITPDEIFITFASRDADQMATIDTVASGSSVEFGVEDPVDADANKVGEFTRTAGVQWQELQFRAAPEPKDIQFDNFDVAKIDIYIPSDTEFADGGLQRFFVFGFADMSQTQEWWNSPTQFEVSDDNVIVGEWHTYEFDLTEVKEREDLDMIFLGIGGGGHEAGGTFYIRNLIFE